MRRLAATLGLGLVLCAAALVISQESGHVPNRPYFSQSGAFYLNGASFYNSDTTPSDISTQLNVLDSLSATELAYVDAVTAGTAAASKALVLGSAKEIATITSATITNVDAGASGSAGTVDVFPTTAAKGKLAITAADSAGDTTTTIVNASQAGARTYTIPDAGASTSFVMAAGAQTIAGVKTFSSNLGTSSGVGAVAGTGVTVTEYGDGVMHQTTLTFTNVDVALADAAGVVAYGSLKVYDLPEGAIRLLGATSDLDLTKSSAGVNDDWDGDVGLGTTAADNDASLATTEQDLVPTTATPQAAAGATTANAQSTATEDTVHDGTTTAKDVYVNLLVDDADHDVTGTACNLILNGTITIVWANLGDY